MKCSKEELKAKVNDLISDNEIAIQLLEDIEDSMEVDKEVDSELQAKLDELQAKLDDITEKYKQRFLQGDSKEDSEVEEPTEELEEKEIVDVKEI